MKINPVTKEKDDDIKPHKYLIDPEMAAKFRDKLIERNMDKAYKNKWKALENGDTVGALDVWRASSEYIKTQVLECIPSRDIRLDIKMAMDVNGNRGIPRGKTIEISGDTELFKSARLYQFYADLQKDKRGAIIKHYETESKFQRRYVRSAGVDLDRVILSCPPYIEAVYEDIIDTIIDYANMRNAAVFKYLKDNGYLKKKSLTHDELDKIIHEGAMSFPILVFGYDSVGNHPSLLQWKKTQAGKESKTPGAHAAAHAEGFRKIKTALGNAMGLFIYINHTKDVLNIGGGKKSRVKLTDTYGGRAVKLMSDIRIEHKSGAGDTQQNVLTVTKNGESIVTGRWLTVKFMKNSIIETSKTKIEHCLFSYKYGFNAGVSYLLALDMIDQIKGKVSLAPNKETKIIMPNDEIVSTKFNDFHELLMEDESLRNAFRKMIVKNANKNAVVKKDV